MDTILNYLNNLFANLPKTPRVLQMKADLQASMEDKYHALKAEGKSENEAIGMVISEFGNIDELVSELGLAAGPAASQGRIVEQDEADQFIAATKRSGFMIAIGVFFCIIAAAVLILFGQLFADGVLFAGLTTDASGALGLIPMFILIAAGVCLFIYAGLKLDKFKYLEGDFELLPAVKTKLEHKKEAFAPTFTLAIMLGVGLCILSPLGLFIAAILGKEGSSYGVVILLAMVAIAVFFFVYFGMIKDAYNKLLKLEDYAREKKEADKVVGAIAAIVWPLAVAVFLFLGFVYGMWHPAWVIFPILGLLFGVFSAAYSALKKK
jgi:hypothetical protein